MSRFLLLLPGLLVLLIASSAVLQPDPVSADVRVAERLWAEGRIAEARQQWLHIAERPRAPLLATVRLATIALLRGDCVDAHVRAAKALAHGERLRRDEAAQMHLVAGQCAALRGDGARADAEWSAVDARSPLRPLADLLRAEHALRANQTDAATRHYQAVLDSSLREPWRSVAHLRLALLHAADDPAAAAQHLATIPATLPLPIPVMQPFLPLTVGETLAEARQLQAILGQPEPQRFQMLGQQLLELGLFRLAIARFERVPADAPEAVLANAHAAFARWQIGQSAAATTQLGELASYAPQEPIAATLYATVALHNGDLDGAAAALDQAEVYHPLDPAIALVRSDLFAARRDYPRAINELRRARDIAQPETKGRYAIALAEQHLALTYDLCGNGIVAAREATTIAPADPATWQVLAEVLYHCRAYDEAADAARNGLGQSESAALEFFLGAALHERGNRNEGRVHLIRAADLAPASEWRQRAEQILQWP